MFYWGLVLFFLGVFLKIGRTHESTAIRLLDERIMLSLLPLRAGILNGIAVDITALGSATVIGLFSFAGAVVLLLSKDKFGALQLAVAAIGNAFLSPLLKIYFERERPSLIPHLVEVMHFSYPSGHSLAAASMYLTLALLGCKHLKMWNAQVLLIGLAGLFILLIGASRVYLGVHYPSDVLGGISLGSAWALLLGWIVSGLERAKKPKGHSG
jgi:undecaprenyl-diphosphatase